MTSKAAVALAIGAGYVLGRSHKMRWAILLGTAALVGLAIGLWSRPAAEPAQAPSVTRF